MIVLLFIILSSNNNLDLIDQSISLFPVNEEILYSISRRGIRIIHGFPLDYRRYKYGAKFEIPLFSELSLYYRFSKDNIFDLYKELQRVELYWIPRKGNFPPLTYSIVVAPDFKREDDKIGIDLIGMDFGYWRNLANNHGFYIIAEDFNNKNRYNRLPIRFELEGRIRNKWASISYYYLYKLPGRISVISDDIVMI